MEVLAIMGVYLNPILAIVFCINLVSVMKKIKREEETERNTFWMSVSFAYIVFSLTWIMMLS
ncbi:hypothetical protein [Sporosarcina sp. Te-1]|uniref:hypothetical protein n=1 Tax=Sporosarcina sp. Te-1 TaxID=2818390 RepID=UPI001A9EF530|nr:hypothetical protein [Sporosarcina sp. Te-1]QTD42085.1 hypothetical protein J3U78_04430 [Sporosarcina sp. Te-1]